MDYLRLGLGIVVGMIGISLVAEGIEFLLITSLTGKGFEEVQADPVAYFEVRNQTWVLLLKFVYSFVAGILGGWLASLVAGREKAKDCAMVLMILQAGTLVYAGFLSEMAINGPTFMWIGLILIIPVGIWMGYQIYLKRLKAPTTA